MSLTVFPNICCVFLDILCLVMLFTLMLGNQALPVVLNSLVH